MKKHRIALLLIVLILFTSTSIYASNLPSGILRQGSRGAGVREVQNTLNHLGYSLSVDGIYGKATRSAVLDLQRKYKELGNDGIYGASTKAVMEKLSMGKEIPKANVDKGKVAYLTFDDGPSTTVTPQILDTLAKYNIKGTFFVLGSMAEKNPEILKRIQAEGHSIGNHSYSHIYNVVYKNMDSFWNEINTTNKIMKEILGDDFNTRIIRFPGGSFENYKKKYVNSARENGYRVYDWNALNGDSEVKNSSRERLIKRLKETTRGQKELVVLMHDTYGKETTAQSLGPIIEYLLGQGYSFEKIEQ